MNIQTFINNKKIAYVANLYEYGNNHCRISSIRFFSRDGVERGYITPSSYNLTNQVNIVNKGNAKAFADRVMIADTQFSRFIKKEVLA